MTIFVTMRHDYLKDRKELRISVDLALIQFFKEIEDDVRLLNPINELSFIDLTKLNTNVLVLSGGPDVNEYPSRDKFETELIAHAKLNNIKTIGICRGFQLLNLVSGGTSIVREKHLNTRHQILDFQDKNPTPRITNSFHRNVITSETLSAGFLPLCTSTDGSIESAISVERDQLGIMWHPEREEHFHRCDIKLISDFLEATLN